METGQKLLVRAASPMTISTPTEETSYSPPSSQLSPTSVLAAPLPPHPVVLSPCAACKILRRRCIEKCMLAPYFPPTDPHKFTIAHRVFGASNIIKLLQVHSNSLVIMYRFLNFLSCFCKVQMLFVLNLDNEI